MPWAFSPVGRSAVVRVQGLPEIEARFWGFTMGARTKKAILLTVQGMRRRSSSAFRRSAGAVVDPSRDQAPADYDADSALLYVLPAAVTCRISAYHTDEGAAHDDGADAAGR
jgi:hypothetical protein